MFTESFFSVIIFLLNTIKTEVFYGKFGSTHRNIRAGEKAYRLAEIPKIDLYMDQVIQLFENKFDRGKT